MWLQTLAHRGVCALGMATTTDNICSLRLAFAIRAAIVTIFLGDAVATGMGAFLWSFHVDPRCTLLAEPLRGDSNSRSSRRSMDRRRS